MKLFQVVFVAITIFVFSSLIWAAEDIKPSVKISVFQSSQIEVDGKVSSLAQLEQKLIKLKKEDGFVWYYREASEKEPPPVAMKVIELIIGNGLPVTLSSKPDFSDIIDDKGNSIPRK